MLNTCICVAVEHSHSSMASSRKWVQELCCYQGLWEFRPHLNLVLCAVAIFACRALMHLGAVEIVNTLRNNKINLWVWYRLFFLHISFLKLAEF